MSFSKVPVENLVGFLKDRREQGQRVGLLLGNRTGVLYSGKLYDILRSYMTLAESMLKLLKDDIPLTQHLSEFIKRIQQLDDLPLPAKYRECYRILNRFFSEKGIYEILLNALKPLYSREEDELLAKLIKAEFFNTIMTTNLDTSLEDACNLLDLQFPEDYTLFPCTSNEKDDTQIEENSRCGQIIKVFGDFSSLDYKMVGREFNQSPKVKQFLMKKMAKEMVILGYDPTWDGSLELLFREREGTLWYVNEEELAPDSHLATVLNARDSKFVHIDGSYHDFLQKLVVYVGGDVNWKADADPPLHSASPPSPLRTKVFISYCHKDKEYLHILLKNLKGFLYAEEVYKRLKLEENIWHDEKIPPAGLWEEEITQNMKYTKLAVTLISQDYFASSFIQEVELPTLYEAADTGDVAILPALLRPSAFLSYPKLSRHQAIDDRILSELGQHEQEVILMKLAEQIYKFLKSGASSE